MSSWNNIATKHWLDRFRGKPEYQYNICLMVAISRGYVSFNHALASGFPIAIDHWSRDDDTYAWCRDVEQKWQDHKRHPEWYPYPFPFPVLVGEDAYNSEYPEFTRVSWIQKKDTEEVAFPSTGIYIYYHPYEGYKIGLAENVPRRIDQHRCAAPSLEVLHVIETANLDWCERFIHGKFARWRKQRNHEYFDLHWIHLSWLFGIDVLNPPKSMGDQLSLLELL